MLNSSNLLCKKNATKQGLILKTTFFCGPVTSRVCMPTFHYSAKHKFPSSCFVAPAETLLSEIICVPPFVRDQRSPGTKCRFFPLSLAVRWHRPTLMLQRPSLFPSCWQKALLVAALTESTHIFGEINVFLFDNLEYIVSIVAFLHLKRVLH